MSTGPWYLQGAAGIFLRCRSGLLSPAWEVALGRVPEGLLLASPVFPEDMVKEGPHAKGLEEADVKSGFWLGQGSGTLVPLQGRMPGWSGKSMAVAVLATVWA